MEVDPLGGLDEFEKRQIGIGASTTRAHPHLAEAVQAYADHRCWATTIVFQRFVPILESAAGSTTSTALESSTPPSRR